VRILPIIILGTIFLFFAGLVAPRRSQRLERWIDQRLQDGRDKGRHNAGWVGDWTAKSLAWGQRLVNGALHLGRRVRDRLPA